MLNISKNLLILNFTDFKVTHFNLIYLIILFFILYLILNQLSSFKKNKWLNSIPILVTLSGLLMILFPTYFIEIFKLNSENSFVIEMGAYITLLGQIFFFIKLFYGYKNKRGKKNGSFKC